ncbi:MAG: GMC family oxidoreductase N-terminal domain-containing protein, partial [Phycisphaerae bacterium]
MLYNRQVIKSWPEPPPAPARPPAPLPPALKQGKASFDYVVIGAGSAGCAFVSQLLSSSANVSVLLLEAGAANDVPEIRDFTKAMNLRGTKYDWNDKSQPQTCMDGEHMPYDAGKVYGGSSSINGMVWVRGNPADYDIWASQGNKGWNWSDVEPVFKRQERWAGQSSPVRGNKGPIYVTDELSINPVSKDFVTTVVNMGFSRNPDYNAQTQYGVGFSQLNVKPSSEPAVYGIRQDSFNTLVGPWLGDERLIPLQDARVQHIDLVNGRADTVRFNFGGDPVTVGVNKEVILCAGTLRSPQVLMLSGIGDPDALRKLGIPVAAPLPGVGRNLQDQVIGFVLRALKRTDPGHFSPMCANIFANGLPGS